MSASRFTLKELTAKRISDALIRRIADFPHAFSWVASTDNRITNKNNLLLYQNKHQNDRCFIIGNGPSLRKMDLSPIRNEYTFGLNRIYLLFKEISFQSTYFVCVNELVLEQFSEEIQQLPMPKFLNWNRRRHFQINDANTMFLRLKLSLFDQFNPKITHPISNGGTVTFVAMQIAFFMGFREVILIGVDHNFTDKGIPNTTEVRREDNDPNHFHADYFPKGSRWQFPDLKRSELSYSLAREAYSKAGRRIVDATLDGKCQIFDKVNYQDLF